MAAQDPHGFGLPDANPQAPTVAPFAITKSDTEELPFVTRRIFVGTGGDVKLAGPDQTDGQAVIYKAASGSYLYVAARKVLSTGTTASALIGEP